MMKLIGAIMAVVLPSSLALAQPQLKSVGPGGSNPRGYTASGRFCVPSQGSQGRD